jgi:hypothetical protein
VTIMTTTSTTRHRSLVSLNLPKNVSALISHAQAIVLAMSGNPAFPSPTPTLAQIAQATSDLQAAETAALTRTKGTVAVRDEKRAVLVMRLQETRASVQAVANANPETATSVIQSAGLAVRRPSVPGKRVFAAKDGRVSGSVNLVTVATAKRASYDWQSSTDGGKTWASAPSTLQAKTAVAGLTPGATVIFRYRAVTKVGVGDWSQGVSIVVR